MMIDEAKRHLRTLLPRSLQSRLIVVITVLVMVSILILGTFFSATVALLLESQIGKRALAVSKTVALNPTIVAAIKKGDPEGRIQEIAESIRERVGAEFVVVGDIVGRRYSHPNEEKLGRQMVGGDNAPALQLGRSYVSKAVGTLGPSIRGKVPLKDESGNIIGVVSVGFLMTEVNNVIHTYQTRIKLMVIILIFFGVMSAIAISRVIKRAIFGLEPRQIAALFTQRDAILQSIREGIIAVDPDGCITMANQTALGHLGAASRHDIEDRPVDEVIPEAHLMTVMQTGEQRFDHEVSVGGRTMIMNALPIEGGGAVASFRDRDELFLVAKELADVRQYTDMLRAQAHEYVNKLHTIAGLLQIGATSDALAMILDEACDYDDFVRRIIDICPDPVLSAMIIGKYIYARELKVTFDVEKGSRMHNLPPQVSREKLVGILGNIIDNALEAVISAPTTPRMVMLALSDYGQDLVFDIEDSGGGAAESVKREMFTKGFSTKKGAGRGMGLYIVTRNAEAMDASISVEPSSLGGLAFSIVLPLSQGVAHEDD